MQVPEECPLAIAQLIDDCLENPPKERPSARQAYDIIKAALTPSHSPPLAQEVRLYASRTYALEGLNAQCDNASLCSRCGRSPPSELHLDMLN